mmetsp:Transcript_8694/g.27682  ORF Transcript_8694/g.27682 Transcript_8694/m.27682 type:complete len:235 (-) Transcript_8694:879-1583(-)
MPAGAAWAAAAAAVAAAGAFAQGTGRAPGDAPRRATPMDGAQERGKTSPASSAAKSAPRKRSALRRRRSRSPSTRPCRAERYGAQVCGGTKRSPSLRLSDSAGWKTSLRRPAQSSSSPGARSALTADQKAPPEPDHASEDFSLPIRTPGNRVTDVRSRPPRSKSTPWARAGCPTAARSVGVIAALPLGSPPPIMENAEGSALRPTVRASARGAIGMSGAIWASAILSMPKSTPP